jgi:hypothetical protein
MPLRDVLFTLPLVFLVLHLAAAPVFIALLWKRSVRAAIIWLALLAATTLAAVPLSVYASGMFGAGSFLICLSPFTVAISLVLVLLFSYRFFRAYEDDRVRRRTYVVGGAIAVILQILLMVGHWGVQRACYAQAQQRADPILAALASYHQENGAYPQTLDELLPAYLDRVPEPGCGWLQAYPDHRDGFELARCDLDATLLTVDSLNGDSIRRYNLNTDRWSSASFLDGTCSYLK